MLAVSLAVIGHMVYENFFRKPLRTDYTIDEFKAARVVEGLSEKMSEEDMAVCMRINNYQNIWTQIPNSEEPSFRQQRRNILMRLTLSLPTLLPRSRRSRRLSIWSTSSMA